MENAYKGIKKIFVAEMFAVLSIFIVIISVIISYSSVNLMVATVILSFSIVLEVLEFILIFIGACQAVKAEKGFNNVRILVIFLVIITVIQMITVGNGILTKGLGIANNVLELFLILNVIKACVTIADKLKDKQVSNLGKNAVKTAVATFFISLALYLTIYVIGARSGGVITEISDTLEVVIIMGSLLSLLIAYFMYIRMLSKTVKMLEEYEE